jgi:hypothetical protein
MDSPGKDRALDVKDVELYLRQTTLVDPYMRVRSRRPSDKGRPRADEIGKLAKLSPIVADPSSS